MKGGKINVRSSGKLFNTNGPMPRVGKLLGACLRKMAIDGGIAPEGGFLRGSGF